MLSTCQGWPARLVGPKMECTNLKDCFLEEFKMAHSESNVRHFEAVLIKEVVYELSSKLVHSICEMIELVGQF